MVTGQLLDTSLPTIFRPGVRVTLWNLRQSFVTVRTNEWGEFLGEIEDSGELMVSIRIQKREIVIFWPPGTVITVGAEVKEQQSCRFDRQQTPSAGTRQKTLSQSLYSKKCKISEAVF